MTTLRTPRFSSTRVYPRRENRSCSAIIKNTSPPTQQLRGKVLLITAGPTREYIDPVRYISNDSSGKMGYALAEAAVKMGAKVTLISGPTNLARPRGAKFIPVMTAREMYKASLSEGRNADIIICAAAVADFRPKNFSKHKIKKTGYRESSIEHQIKLVENPDILKSLCQRKKPHQIIVGFALETENLVKNAQKKLAEKKCDVIIVNSNKTIGRNETSLKIIRKDERFYFVKQLRKNIAAQKILAKVIKHQFY